MKLATPRHWLDKATPKYWNPRAVWRVRAMRDGQPFQWVLTAGRGDPGSTGRALAFAEWQRKRSEIITGEANTAVEDETGGMFPAMSRAEEREHYAAQTDRDAYQSSPFADAMTFEQWRAFTTWQASRATMRPAAQTPAEKLPAVSQPFSALVDVWKAELKRRYEQTTPGLRSNDDLGRKRYDEYVRCADHLVGVVGTVRCEPTPEGALISGRTLGRILETYKDACRAERAKRKLSGSWANERMKTARALAQYLADRCLVSSLPANISHLTEKYEVHVDPRPMPFGVVRALYAGADEWYKGLFLLMLNCGFRQAELAALEPQHVQKIGGQVAVVKRRGKTGVPFAIPLWPETTKFLAKYGNKAGLLLTVPAEHARGGSEGQALIRGNTDSIYHPFISLRARVAKSCPEVMGYSLENFRDCGATFCDGYNPILTPLYLAQGDGRTAKHYVGRFSDADAADIKATATLAGMLTAFRKALRLTK